MLDREQLGDPTFSPRCYTRHAKQGERINVRPVALYGRVRPRPHRLHRAQPCHLPRPHLLHSRLPRKSPPASASLAAQAELPAIPPLPLHPALRRASSNSLPLATAVGLGQPNVQHCPLGGVPAASLPAGRTASTAGPTIASSPETSSSVLGFQS